MTELSPAYVASRLAYDPESGELTWLVGSYAGRRAGRLDTSGYRQVFIGGRRRPATHIIWLMMTGRLPSHFIDHRNRDKADDRWANLREASRSENARNSPGRSRYYAFKGIKPLPRKSSRWQARISVDGKYKHLGCFDTPELAARAYDDAARRFHGEFACTNF